LKHKTLFILILLLILTTVNVAAENTNLFFNNKNITDNVSLKKTNGEILIKAVDFADLINADLNWEPNLKILDIKTEDTKIKMMDKNKKIQINNSLIDSKNGLKIFNNKAFVPIVSLIEIFGYLTKYDNKKDDLYISKPSIKVEDIKWRNETNQLEVSLNKSTPYRISKDKDGKGIQLEIANASVSENFSDHVSNKNYYLKVENVPKKALLRISIRSRYFIPFNIDGGVTEEKNKIILHFLPQLKEIRASGKSLDILSTGETKNIEISYIKKDIIFIDIKNVVIGDHKLRIDNHKYIENVKVKQKSLDPVSLRLIVHLKDNAIMKEVANKQKNKTTFKFDYQNKINNLSYYKNVISFYSENKITPNVFTLGKPPRLIIDLDNTTRGEKVKDDVVIKDGIVNNLRSSQFNKNTTRIVADLNEMLDYSVNQLLINDQYKYEVSLKNEIKNIIMPDKNTINIELSKKTDFEVKTFNEPFRLVFDFKELKDNIKSLDLPEFKAIKDVRSGYFKVNEEKLMRLVFEFDQKKNYRLEEKNNHIIIHLNEKEITTPQVEPKNKTIVIDAGHGGFDPGAVGVNGLQEKEAVLSIALKSAQVLKNHGYKVILTRDTDKFLSLWKRVDIANKSKADIFISIHANSFYNNSAHGIETFFKSNQGKKLADRIQDKLSQSLNRENRGIKYGNFYVISKTHMPSVLVETGFVSNKKEAILLQSQDYINRIADSILKGVNDYFY